MLQLTRSFENPILVPDSQNQWEAGAVFNPSVIKGSTGYQMVYRAMSEKIRYQDKDLELSTIGYAESPDPVHFTNRRQLIAPEYDWEKYGCEDPRMTKIENRYYIFYTALSNYPFNAEGIKVAVAETDDLANIKKKHLVTPFNAKGAALFPEKIGGQYAVILTANTDKPPATIGVAYFDRIEDIKSQEIWTKWYDSLADHKINLLRDPGHQVEVGGVPIKTKYGWLLLYAYIQNYFTPDPIFGIEAALLDLKDPQRVLARTTEPLLTPREQYESFGQVPYTIFPTSGVVVDDMLYVYYGAADTTTAVATCDLEMLLGQMKLSQEVKLKLGKEQVKLTRENNNPIIKPDPKHEWEAKFTYNPAAILLNKQVHILYRAQGEDNVSTIGYARSTDGVTISERLPNPIYIPREKFEVSGCEDARITQMDDKLYMFYTAFKSGSPTHIALTAIKTADFLDKKWNWSIPQIISPSEINDKNACLLPEKINGKYVIFHRTNHMIWIDETETLDFSDGRWIQGNILWEPKEGTWYSEKVGIAAPPMKTTSGWLLVWHALSKYDSKYRLGAMLLNLKDPLKIKAVLDYPILEPEAEYENSGLRPGTVFSNGAVILNDKLYVYYGAGDTTVAVASVEMEMLLFALRQT